MLTKNGGVNQVGATNVPGLMTSSESEDTSSDEDPRINYVKNAKYVKKSHKKSQKYPKKVHRDRMNAIIESQTDQIANLTYEINKMALALASKPSGLEANTANAKAVNFPYNILDINKEAETDIFHFL